MHLLFIVKAVDNEPQGILLISSVLKQAGHQVSLVVATEEDVRKHAAGEETEK